MTVTATSLKLPRRLKARIDRLSRRSGESAHAYMVRALEGHVTAEERYQAFLDDGVRADEAMVRSGLGYASEDVHAYVTALAEGRKPRRPKPVRWRK
jgi:predicted transcriptional regulator